jgi:two-component system KDP operon response regulator KdpE
MSKKARVLVVDDDPRLLRFVRANLESVDYEVFTATEGSSALELVERERLDLIVLDIMLPGMDGYELCQRVREFSTLPIIMLTARDEEADKVRGLRLGADDYLTKPFGAQELLARVEAVLRRAQMAGENHTQPVLVYGDLKVDLARRRVTVRDEELGLTPTEYKLLAHLASNGGRVMLHEELLTRVWGAEYRDELDYLRAYIRYLRQKIEEDPHQPRYILSKPGVGYILVSPD